MVTGCEADGVALCSIGMVIPGMGSAAVFLAGAFFARTIFLAEAFFADAFFFAAGFFFSGIGMVMPGMCMCCAPTGTENDASASTLAA